jgi:predicted DCC family thiol-disulfide oxidoreductase YuxK
MGMPWRQRLRRAYLSVDPRSLGLGRILLALVLIANLLRRIPDINLWYTNTGMIPNHTLLWRPPTQWMFSLFFMASWTDEVAVGFVICGIVFLLLLIGWRTRLMQVLSLVCLLSLHGRSTFLENGGDWTLAELTLWTSFLPLGRRFSVDAVLASMRRRRETTAAELEDRAALGPDARALAPVISLAVLAILLQLADSYFFNCINKGGQTWRQGTAVHYVLHQDRMVTWFGVWMRPHMSLALSRVLSWSALATEAVLPVLILSPFFLNRTRRMAVLAIIGLHTGFQLFINLGIFSWAMIGYTPYLLTAAEWDLFTRLERTRRRKLTAYFDAGCGVCFQIVRVLARLDRFARVRFVSSAEADPLPEGVTPDLLDRTILVVDEASGRRWTRADAVAQILSALPVGFLWAFPLRVPGLRQLANAAYGVFARRRQSVSYWLGLAACSVARPLASEPAPASEVALDPSPSPAPALEMAPVPPPAPALVAPERQRAPLTEWLRAHVAWLRELAVAGMIITLVSETIFIQELVPKFLKHTQPLWIKQAVAYPRLIQAWSMFASDAPTTDESVVVEAVTVDGRRVDPYSEVAGRYPYPGHNEIPARLDNDSFFFNYSSRIPFKPEYFGAFQDWILAYPDRTGRPQDRIVRFEAYIVEDDSPPVGETQPRNVRSRVFLSFPPK